MPLLMACGFTVPAAAGINAWTSNGPPGGGTTHLLIDPKNPATVYVAMLSGGIFKTSNGGETWRPVNQGLTSQNVSALAIDPQNSSTLYAAATYGGTIFKTIDGGETWQVANTGLRAFFVTDLQVDPTNSSNVYVATDSGLYKSSNSALSWNKTKLDSASGLLTVDPKNPNVLYISISGRGFFKSNDGGETWISINGGFPPVPPTTAVPVGRIEIDPANSSTLYTVFGRPFKSTNGGLFWNPIHTGLPTDLDSRRLVLDPQQPGTLYVGGLISLDSNSNLRGAIYKSTDDGKNWNLLTDSLTYVLQLAINARNPLILYAGTFSAGTFKTTDGGTTWQSVNHGLNASRPVGLAIDPKDPAVLYAGTQGDGLYKTTDAGNSWLPLRGGLPIGYITALAVDQADSAVVYAGGFRGGIYKSEDGGAGWNVANAGLPSPSSFSVVLLAVDPHDSGAAYAAISIVEDSMPGPRGRLYRTTNGGAMWTELNLGPNAGAVIDAIVFDPQKPGTLYLGASSGNIAGVLKSTDGGASWQLFNSGFGVPHVASLAVDPQTPSILYASDWNSQVYRSFNGGESWTRVGAGLPTGFTFLLAVDPHEPRNVFAATSFILSTPTNESNMGVYRSSDGGSTWTKLKEGLTGLQVYGLAVDGRAPSAVYAATWGGGVASITLIDPPRPRRRP